MKKRLLFSLALLLICFSGACSYQNAGSKPAEGDPVIEESGPAEEEPGDLLRVTYVVINGDPASYSVYEFTGDTFRYFDYTKYWLEKNSFDYFNDPVPEGDEYLVKEAPIAEGVWDTLGEALSDNRFYTLPEVIEAPDGTYDAASVFIEAETENGTCLSGGYGAGSGNGRYHNRFDKIRSVLERAISVQERDPGESVLTIEPETVPSDTDTWYSSDGSVYIVQDHDNNESYLFDGDERIPLEIGMGSYGPVIEKADVNGDGEYEYLIADCEGTGTGVSLYGLTIVGRSDDGYKVVRYGADYFSNILEEEIGYNYYEDTGEVHVFEILPPWFDRHEGCTAVLDRKTNLEDIVWSDIIQIRFEEDRVYMYAPSGYVFEDSPIPDYSNAVIAEAELLFDEDYKIKTLFWKLYPDEDDD